MRIYRDFLGEQVECECIGCFEKRGRKGWGTIWEDDSWRVHQDFAVPMLGLMVLETKRHVKALDELNLQERSSLGGLLIVVSASVKEATAQEGVAVVLEEASSHFHIWFMPQNEGERLSGFPQLFKDAQDRYASGQTSMEQVELVGRVIGDRLNKRI